MTILLAALLLSSSPAGLAIAYVAVCLGIVAAGLLRQHLLLVVTTTTPILLALMLVWGLVLKQGPNGEQGVAYALTTWLRIAALGGLFQWFFLPLAHAPAHLRAFLQTLRAPPWVGALLVGPVVFLPEVQRRLARVVDARRAQGGQVHGLSGLIQVPTLLTPLVASLLESAMVRAELWDHRGYLRERGTAPATAHLSWASIAVPAIAAAVAALTIRLGSPWT